MIKMLDKTYKDTTGEDLCKSRSFKDFKLNTMYLCMKDSKIIMYTDIGSNTPKLYLFTLNTFELRKTTYCITVKVYNYKTCTWDNNVVSTHINAGYIMEGFKLIYEAKQSYIKMQDSFTNQQIQSIPQLPLYYVADKIEYIIIDDTNASRDYIDNLPSFNTIESAVNDYLKPNKIDIAICFDYDGNSLGRMLINIQGDYYQSVLSEKEDGSVILQYKTTDGTEENVKTIDLPYYILSKDVTSSLLLHNFIVVKCVDKVEGF